MSNGYRNDDKGYSINLFNDVLYKDGHTYRFVMQEDKVTSWERLKALVEHHLKLDRSQDARHGGVLLPRGHGGEGHT